MPKLRFVDDTAPGITRRRVRSGKWAYFMPDGTRITDRDEIDRLNRIALPPAYGNCWYCPQPDGHLLAVGFDARGRKQYRYHPDWREEREARKFDLCPQFGLALPALRKRVTEDLAGRKLTRERAIASVVALVVWIGLEWHASASQPMAPVLHLSFDKGFPAEGYLARPHGNEVVARPGRVGSGLFIGGDEDWLEVQAPQGFDTRQGMTLAFWMRREAWVNPYVKGAATQTVATVQLERLWRGKPEAQHVTFSFAANTARPQARVGDVRLVPSRAISIAPQRWTHVAVVYDRFLFDRMRLYVDGRRVARAAPWAAAPGFADIRSVRIGTWFERNGAYRGMVDEVKVYARALTDAEIEAEAAAGS